MKADSIINGVAAIEGVTYRRRNAMKTVIICANEMKCAMA